MLILARKRNERILIGNDIIVTITDIERDKVRVGIEAPRGVSVDREEIRLKPDYQRRERE